MEIINTNNIEKVMKALNGNDGCSLEYLEKMLDLNHEELLLILTELERKELIADGASKLDGRAKRFQMIRVYFKL